MDNNKTIKILVGYHKPAVLIKNDIFAPIHLGRALATEASKDGKMSEKDYQWMLDNMIGDDTGDNISELNRRLCEITALYWAWKNNDKIGNPDYIGFCHYRRFINFTAKKLKEDKDGIVSFPSLNQRFIKLTGLEDGEVKNCVTGFDIVTVTKWNVKNQKAKNIYEQFKNYPKLHCKDYDTVLEILREKYPEYGKSIDIYNKSDKGYFTNIFVMKKDIFNDYCSWLFDILFEAVKQIPQYNDAEENGGIAHIAERLFGIYITHMKLNNKNLKIKECQRTYIEKTELTTEIVSMYDGEIPIIMSADNTYVPYLAVTIQSIIENAPEKAKYSIYVLHNEISKINQNKILKMQNAFLTIQFVDISSFFDEQNDKLFYTCNHFSVATYFRFFIPKLFKSFKKVIYCDCDAVFLKDVSKLYDIDLKTNWLAAVKDTMVNIDLMKSLKAIKYYKDFLKLERPDNYFQAGLLIINIEELLKNNFTELCLNTLKIIKRPKYVDQCILNKVCENKVLFLNNEWNVEHFIPLIEPNFKNFLSKTQYESFQEAWLSPAYLHFC